MKNLKKYLTLPYTKPIFIIVVSIFWILAFYQAYDGDSFRWGKAVHETGDLGWKMLIFTIFISLFQKISAIHFPKVWIFSCLLPLRKYSGIFAFLIVLSHTVAQFLKSGILGNFPEMVSMMFSTYHAMIFGSISFLIMLPLFLTSTNWAVKKMGRKAWKNLQRFTHVAFLFAVLHIALTDFFGPGKIDPGPFVLLTIYTTGYGYLWWHKRTNT